MRATDFVESYFEAWNHGDSRAVADHLATDGVHCDIPENVQRSQDELIATLEAFFAEYRHRYELIGEILSGADTIAFQYQVCRLGHRYDGVGQENYQGAEFMTLNGNAAMTITDYYDTPGTVRHPVMPRLQRTTANKYAKSGLNGEQLHEYKQLLADVMQTQQVFLQSDLTLPKLAKNIGCSVNHLSQVINSGFGVSFFDFLNQHRIEFAKTLLSKPDSQNSAILNIAFTVGFNSNSAFYAAFKKRVGQTPAQYRRAQLRKSH